MGFTADLSIPVLTVFLQGLLSFFSPCVLPMLPLYIGYLSGSGENAGDGTLRYSRGRCFVNTLFFVLGTGFAFFLLGLGMTALGTALSGHRMLVARIGGVLVILLGLYQLGVFGESAFLARERRLPLRTDRLAMSPLTALLMGFVFSFAWTPCIGPTLSSVLLLAASAASQSRGMLLIGVYTLGFAVPFLAVGLFASTLLDFLRRHRGAVRWTVRIGAVLMILTGILMLTGLMNNVTGYLSRVSDLPAAQSSASAPAAAASTAAVTTQTAPSEPDPDAVPAPDFELTDQYGTVHRLSDYQGKVVFLNCWATWCPPCRAEMPDIQALYEKYGPAADADVVILGVAFPGLSGETDADGVAAFLAENGYTYPVAMDDTGTVLVSYGISAFPTTFMIDADGNVFGYVPGAMSAEIMQSIIDQTLAGKRE